MIRIVDRLLCGCLAAAMAGTALAHGGHAVPPGVAPHAHLHLVGGVLVAPEWLLVLVIATVAAVLVASRARRDGAAGARDHAQHR